MTVQSGVSSVRCVTDTANNRSKMTCCSTLQEFSANNRRKGSSSFTRPSDCHTTVTGSFVTCSPTRAMNSQSNSLNTNNYSSSTLRNRKNSRNQLYLMNSKNTAYATPNRTIHILNWRQRSLMGTSYLSQSDGNHTGSTQKKPTSIIHQSVNMSN